MVVGQDRVQDPQRGRVLADSNQPARKPQVLVDRQHIEYLRLRQLQKGLADLLRVRSGPQPQQSQRGVLQGRLVRAEQRDVQIGTQVLDALRLQVDQFLE